MKKEYKIDDAILYDHRGDVYSKPNEPSKVMDFQVKDQDIQKTLLDPICEVSKNERCVNIYNTITQESTTIRVKNENDK